MRVSAKELYGLRAMSELVRHYGQGPLSLAEVARTQSISQAYLEQIAIELRRAGLLSSQRGAQGGYTLARPPQAITAGDVIRGLEGSILPIQCMAEHKGPPLRPRSDLFDAEHLGAGAGPVGRYAGLDHTGRSIT